MDGAGDGGEGDAMDGADGVVNLEIIYDFVKFVWENRFISDYPMISLKN